MSGPPKPRDGSDGAPSGKGSEGGGLATALAATRARLPRGAERRRRPRTTWVAVGAAAVALVLLAALLVGALYEAHLASPTGASTGGTTPSSGAPSTFYGALPAANAEARASYWDWPLDGQPPLVFAEGLASPSALGAVVTSSRLGAVLCSPTVLSTMVPSLPADTAALTAGLASAWLFAFNPSGSTLLVVAVVNGTATMVATTVSNGACYDGPGSFSTVPVDSSVAASAAGASSESKSFFTGASSNGSAVSAGFLLVPPGFVLHGPMDPMWLVNDTTCSLYGGSTVLGTTLSSAVNAATGALYSQSRGTVTC